MIFFQNALTEEFSLKYISMDNKKCKKVRIDKCNFSGNPYLRRIYCGE